MDATGTLTATGELIPGLSAGGGGVGYARRSRSLRKNRNYRGFIEPEPQVRKKRQKKKRVVFVRHGRAHMAFHAGMTARGELIEDESVDLLLMLL